MAVVSAAMMKEMVLSFITIRAAQESRKGTVLRARGDIAKAGTHEAIVDVLQSLHTAVEKLETR